MLAWLNGRFLPASRASVSIFDHGFLYGDGVYETVRISAGRAVFWPDHAQRLSAARRHFKLSCPWSMPALQKALETLARRNRLLEGSVRLTLSRGIGPLGLDPALCDRPTALMQAHSPRDNESLRRKGVAIAISQVRWISPGFKTLSQQPLVMAKAEARRAGFFEPIFQNDRQELTEGATTNLFWVRRGILYTPAVTCGLLPGIVRRHVLALARRLRLPVREGRYFFKALAQADEIFLTNASLLVVPVVRVGRRSLLIGSMTRLLQSGLL